LRKKSNTS
jgi:hypothetical protein